MASIINLENLPELVMDKITSFLNHKQLLALEQVSRKLKCVVDTHFSLTNHLIIGPLPTVVKEIDYAEATAMDKKCLDDFLKIIKRCGIRLRTIQVTVIDQFYSVGASLWNYSVYFKHFFASTEVCGNCPNVQNIIASPKMDFSNSEHYIFGQQNVVFDTEIYANNIKLYTGATCKMRTSLIDEPNTTRLERIINLHSNIEQIALPYRHDNFSNFLPQFMENGLKDLYIFCQTIQDVKKYCNIGKDLRTLRFAFVLDSSDVAAFNKLQWPNNVELQIQVGADPCLDLLSEKVCKYITCCELSYRSTDLMTKLKNLVECWIRNSEQLKVIAEGSFPELKRITIGNTLCDSRNKCDVKTCDLQIFLYLLLTKKCNQLTFIDITSLRCIPIDVLWRALKHCTAAKRIVFATRVVHSPLRITAEDVEAICHLPNIQYFVFKICQNDACGLLRELMDRVVKEHRDFQFKYKSSGWPEQKYSLHKIY